MTLHTLDTPERDNTGRFLPGNAVARGHGRPSKAKELAMLDAIKSSFPPEVVTEHLRRALQIAVETNSARGIVAVLEFVASYSLGKPIQRTEQGSGGLRAVLEELGIDSDDDDEE